MLITEIFTILISILGMNRVECGDQSVNMISFEGEASGPYFSGKVLPGGIDTQRGGQLSARYMLEGTDCEGKPCKMFIENNGKFGSPFTSPSIVTDSKALAALTSDSLVGQIDNSDGKLTIRISRVDPPIPDAVRRRAAQCGTIDTFEYRVAKGKKRARVYLPYGYDKSDKTRKYNVVYLMHGGGDNSKSFLMPPQDWLPLTNVLDHLIADGKMDPVIVVTPSFYGDDTNIGANRMNDAIHLTRDVHKELSTYLIPQVESAYRTHYTGRGKKAVEQSREHRAFGGFSMGALCTWFQLAYGVDAVSRFIPLSGDLWVYDEAGQKQSAEVAARWLNKQLEASPYAHDFRVLAYSGTSDIAGKPEQALVRALYKEAPLFGIHNLSLAMRPEGQHFYGHINEYLYRALPLLWGKTAVAER